MGFCGFDGTPRARAGSGGRGGVCTANWVSALSLGAFGAAGAPESDQSGPGSLTTGAGMGAGAGAGAAAGSDSDPDPDSCPCSSADPGAGSGCFDSNSRNTAISSGFCVVGSACSLDDLILFTASLSIFFISSEV